MLTADQTTPWEKLQRYVYRSPWAHSFAWGHCVFLIYPPGLLFQLSDLSGRTLFVRCSWTLCALRKYLKLNCLEKMKIVVATQWVHLSKSFLHIMWCFCLLNFLKCVAFTLCKGKGQSWRQSGLCLAINLITVISCYIHEVWIDVSAFLNEGRLSLRKDRHTQLLNNSGKPGEHYWLLAMRDPGTKHGANFEGYALDLSVRTKPCVLHTNRLLDYWVTEKKNTEAPLISVNREQQQMLPISESVSC